MATLRCDLRSRARNTSHIPPARLDADISFWPLPSIQLNPYLSRANVEIYNMPVFMAQQSPPLEPAAGTSLVVYT